VLGDGSVTIGASMRDDAYALGTSGTMAKPVETDKPTASGTFTADFNDLTNVNRVVEQHVADVVLKFEGATIASTYKYTSRSRCRTACSRRRRRRSTAPARCSRASR
jgi:hypothetical protein